MENQSPPSSPSSDESTDWREQVEEFATTVRCSTGGMHYQCEATRITDVETYILDFGGMNAKWAMSFLPLPPHDQLDPVDRRLAYSSVMDQIGKFTTIPVPLRICDHIDYPNAFGHPFIMTKIYGGRPLAELWYDKDWFNDRRRKTVFLTLILYLVQLKAIVYTKIGLPHENAVRPGNYSSTHAYLCGKIAQKEGQMRDREHSHALKLLRILAGIIPHHTFDGPPFALSVPGLDLHNVWVDDQGYVVGIYGWDRVEVVPVEAGYARYPPWITGDWVVGHGVSPGSRGLDSDASLAQYRREYLDLMTGIDPEVAKATRNSHIFAALEMAIDVEFVRLDYTHRLAKYVFGEAADLGGGVGLVEGISQGRWWDEEHQ